MESLFCEKVLKNTFLFLHIDENEKNSGNPLTTKDT